MQLIHSHTLAGEGQGTAQFSVRLAGIAVDPQDRLLAIGRRDVSEELAGELLIRRGFEDARDFDLRNVTLVERRGGVAVVVLGESMVGR